MCCYYDDYTREDFIKFLESCNSDLDLINRFENLPVKIIKFNVEYFLNIIVTWHSDNETHYEFEINYYDNEKFVFLFPYKIYNNVRESIKYIETELKKLNETFEN